MPFGNYSYYPKPKTDFSNLNTVNVIANFNTEGRFIPVYFKYINPDQSEQTIKINAIKYIKDNHNRISFCCLYDNYGKQHEIILTFHIKECVWVIE